MAYTKTIVKDGWAVEVDEANPLVALAISRGYDSWIEDGVGFVKAHMENHPDLTEAEALDQLNDGATWIVLRRATPEDY